MDTINKQVILNNCYVTFSVSKYVSGLMKIMYNIDIGESPNNLDFGKISRNDKEYRSDDRLIKAIMMDKKNIYKYRIVIIPDYINNWHITECGNIETIRENHWNK